MKRLLLTLAVPLQRFWLRAPRGFRYDVRANDGTLLTTVRR